MIPVLDTGWTPVLSALAVILAQIYREGRQHRWDEQARERLALQLKVDNAALADNLRVDAGRLADNLARDSTALAIKVSADHATLAAKVAEEQFHASQSRQDIELAIQENTTLTRSGAAAAAAAYKEANGVNLKIEKIGLRARASDPVPEGPPAGWRIQRAGSSVPPPLPPLPAPETS